MSSMNHKVTPLLDPSSLKSMAARLSLSDEYRVLRRIQPRRVYGDAMGRAVRRGLVVDTETTGSDADDCAIVEVAFIPFTYSDDGEVIEVLEEEAYASLNDPGFPIPPESTEVHGITDAMVAGQRIDWERVAALAASCRVVVAHNAGFDRRVLERYCAAFAKSIFLCTHKMIDWRAEGLSSSKLEFIALAHGLFFEAHRAEADARVLLDLLSRPLPRSSRLPLEILRDAARTPMSTILATNTPFAAKNQLYAAGYRWFAGDASMAKGYRKVVPSIDIPDESSRMEQLLAAHGATFTADIRPLHPTDRFSVRE